MEFLLDVNTGRFLNALGFSTRTPALSLKRGDAADIGIRFYDGKTLKFLAVGTEVKLEVKESGEYSADPLMQVTDFARPGAGEEQYVGAPTFATARIATLFNDDEVAGNDVASIPVMLEISWKEPGKGWQSSETVTGRMLNDVIKEDGSILAEIPGDIPAVAATARISRDLAKAGEQLGDLVIGSWTLGLFLTGSSPHSHTGGILTWDTDQEWDTIFAQIANVINGDALDDGDFTLTDDPGAHPTVTASVVSLGNRVELVLTARTAGTAANGVSYSLYDSEAVEEVTGSLSGGLASRDPEVGDFLSVALGQNFSAAERDQLAENWPEALFPDGKGNFGVEFEDDFDRADTSPGTISNAPNGFVYDVRAEGSASGDVRILNGEVTDDNLGGTFYFGGQCIEDRVYNMGAEVEWREPDTGAGAGNNTAIVLIIKPDDAWLNALIHVIVQRASVQVQVAESGGTSNWDTIVNTTFPVDDNANSTNNFFPLDETVKVEAVISGERLQVLMNGAVKADVTDSRIATVNGNRLYWECFGGSQRDDMFIKRIWANDFRDSGHSVARYQGRSRTLDLLSQGILDLWSHARLRLGNLFVDRGHVMASKIFSRSLEAGRNGAWAPVPTLYGQFSDFDAPTETPASASDFHLFADTINANTLSEVGSQLQIRAMGDFAANGESKTLNFFLSGEFLTTTTTINDGHFEIEVWISATTTEAFDCWGKIILSDGTVVMNSWTVAGTSATALLCRVRGTATTAGSIKLSKVIGIMHHSRALDL